MAEELYQPGQLIADRYEIRRLLGRGGMAEVFLAWDRNLHREIALKFLRLNPTLDEQHRRLQKDRLLREARAAAQLNHSGIVVIHDLGETDGHPYISMEYIKGLNLRDVLRRLSKKQETLPMRDVLDICRQLAAALDYAHENKVVHRDVKPENIMITPDGICKVTDFGIARSSLPGLGTLTTQGKLICTWHYTAPEYFQGGDADARGDQFSFGCVVYELLTGRFAFTGQGEHQIWYKITQLAPTPPGDLIFDLPEPVNSIVMKLLAKQPAQRYRTCMEAVTALETAFCDVDPGTAYRTVVTVAASDELTPVQSKPSPETGGSDSQTQVVSDLALAGSTPGAGMDPGSDRTLMIGDDSRTMELNWVHTARIQARGKRWRFVVIGLVAGIVGALLIFWWGSTDRSTTSGETTALTPVTVPTVKHSVTPTVTPVLTTTSMQREPLIPTVTPVPKETLLLIGTPTPASTVASTFTPTRTPTSTKTPTALPTQPPTYSPTFTPTRTPTQTPIPTEAPASLPALEPTVTVTLESEKSLPWVPF